MVERAKTRRRFEYLEKECSDTSATNLAKRWRNPMA